MMRGEQSLGTILELGPTNHGQRLTGEEFETADFQEGFRYELIDGRLCVAAFPNLRHNWVAEWVADAIKAYARARPDVVRYVSREARVFVPGRRKLTTPQPDVAAYSDFPDDPDLNELKWRDVSPMLVVETLSPDSVDKDLVRNVELYRQVPSIKEYWILDNLADANRPSLRVYRRTAKRWRTLDFACGETYATRLLPGFALVIDPRHI